MFRSRIQFVHIKEYERFNWKVPSCRPSFKLRDWLSRWLVCWISSCLEAQCLVAGKNLHMWVGAQGLHIEFLLAPRKCNFTTFGWTWSVYGFAAGMPALGGDFNHLACGLFHSEHVKTGFRFQQDHLGTGNSERHTWQNSKKREETCPKWKSPMFSDQKLCHGPPKSRPPGPGFVSAFGFGNAAAASAKRRDLSQNFLKKPNAFYHNDY